MAQEFKNKPLYLQMQKMKPYFKKKEILNKTIDKAKGGKGYGKGGPGKTTVPDLAFNPKAPQGSVLNPLRGLPNLASLSTAKPAPRTTLRPSAVNVARTAGVSANQLGSLRSPARKK